MTNKQIRQLIASPTQVLVTDGVDPESNLGYYGLSSIGKDLLGVTTTSQGQEALSLVPGTDVQPYDSDLSAIAALTTTGAIERTGAGTAATFTVTNSAKQLLDDSSFASMRTTLELGSISTQSASNVAITGGSISGITDLAIADGGTGSSTAQGAINALAGAVTSGQYLRGNGTNVVMSAIQASDVPTLNQNTTGTAGNVTGIVAVANGGTGANTVPQARTNLGLVIGTNVQAYDSDLDAIAALTTTGLIDRTGAGTAATRATGATGLSVLAAANAATARTAIGAMSNTAPEIITNANGTAYRWPNGLQICIFDGTTATATPTNWGNIFISALVTRTFPAAFSNIPRVAPATRSVVGEGTSACWGLVQVVSATSAAFYALSGFAGGSCRLGYIAIGSYTP